MQQEQSGVVVVDKPADITSADVVGRVKKIFKATKAGHAGTLDPFATGVMVCCINRATRLARFFLTGGKTYEAALRLGVETDTLDFTGTVTAACDDDFFKSRPLSEQTVRPVLKQFEGESEQRPPVYSALKHKGVPLYRLARSGMPVQKPPRRIFISSIELTALDPPDLWFAVSCSAGTYIRTLCADIGRALGCGGHLKALRRTESSGFSVKQAFTIPGLEALAQSNGLADSIISMADALKNMPRHQADHALEEKIINGALITHKDIPLETAAQNNHYGQELFIKIVDGNGELIAVVSHEKNKNRFNYCCVFNNR